MEMGSTLNVDSFPQISETWLAVATLIIAIASLVVAIISVTTTKKSLEITNESFVLDKKERQIQYINDLYVFMEIDTYMQSWIKQMSEILQKLTEAYENKDESAVYALSIKCKHEPKGIVNKTTYKNAPYWLAQFYMSSAILYYQAMHNLKNIWRDDKADWGFFIKRKGLESVIEIFSNNIQKIEEIRAHFKQYLPPKVILEIPDSINDEKFF